MKRPGLDKGNKYLLSSLGKIAAKSMAVPKIVLINNDRPTMQQINKVAP